MGMSLVLGVCILLAFAAWLYQRRFTLGPILRTVNYAVGVAALVAAVYLTDHFEEEVNAYWLSYNLIMKYQQKDNKLQKVKTTQRTVYVPSLLQDINLP